MPLLVVLMLVPLLLVWAALPIWAKAITACGAWFLAKRLRPQSSCVPAPIMSPVAYERYCADVLRRAGWHATLTPSSNDQGIDVLARKGGVRIVIQCKLYSGPVGNAAVQQALAGREYVRAHHAAVVSNAAYTASARDLARRTGVLLLHDRDLINADRLFHARKAI